MAQGRAAVLGDAFITQVLSYVESKKQEFKSIEPQLRQKVTELKPIVDEEFKQSNLMDEARTDFDRILKERRSASEKLLSTIRATARFEREAMIASFDGIKLSYEALLRLKEAEDKAQDRFQDSAQLQKDALSKLARDINGLIAYADVFGQFKDYYETLKTNTQLRYRLYSAVGQSKAAIDLSYQTCQSEYKEFSDKIEQLKKVDEHKVVPSGASQSESVRYSDSRNISRESIATTRSSVSSKDESKGGQHSRSSSSDSSDSRDSSIIVPPQSGRPGMRPLPPIPGTPVGGSASSSNLSTTFGASARKARDAKDNSSSQNQKKERKCTIL